MCDDGRKRPKKMTLRFSEAEYHEIIALARQRGSALNNLVLALVREAANKQQ